MNAPSSSYQPRGRIDPPPEDHELLRRYVDQGDESAFAALVRRRIGLVYSVALRRTHGDAHRAQDATQAVFTDLARKAATLVHRPLLAGWLHRSAQFAAADLVRSEQRRLAREEKAALMQTTEPSPEPEWDKVRPVLDAALTEISDEDRDAVLLRFFDGRPFGEIAPRLRLSENAARMRVERALDRLNAVLARRGITSTSTALGIALAHQAGAALPSGLAASVAAQAMGGAASATGLSWLAFFATGKVQAGMLAVITLAGGTAYLVEGRTHARLESQIVALRPAPESVAALTAENQALAALAREVESLRRDDAELKQLEQRVVSARAAQREKAQARQRTVDQQVQSEIDRMNREGNALVEAYKALSTTARDATLSPEVRAQAEAAAKLKLIEIQAKQREVQAYIASTRGLTSPELGAHPGKLSLSSSGEPRDRLQWTATSDSQISLRIPQADTPALLAAYERMSGLKVRRDIPAPYISAPFDLQTPSCTREQMLELIRTTLRDRMNIVLETADDGSVIARSRTR